MLRKPGLDVTAPLLSTPRKPRLAALPRLAARARTARVLSSPGVAQQAAPFSPTRCLLASRPRED
jgi:hypothetical protein